MTELNELITMSDDNTAVKPCDPMDVMSRCGIKTVLNVSVDFLKFKF